jgi:hypothetical protein
MYKNMTLPVVLYGCETWSLTLRDERKLRVFENSVLGRMFGPNRNQVTGGWRKLHKKELRDLPLFAKYKGNLKSRRMRWAGHVTPMGEKRNVCRLSVRKPEGKRPLGKPRRRWVDNIKMDLVEKVRGGVDWIGLAQDRYRWRALVNAVMHFWVP